MTISADKYSGCLLGLAIGDAFGAPYEGGLAERLVWRVLGRTASGLRRWTDDTQMSLDVATSIISRQSVDLDDIAKRFATSYRWSRGYGSGTSRVLKKIRSGVPWRLANKLVFAEGSFGNGAAMRSPVLALFCPNDIHCLASYARSVGEITHTHEFALQGAVSIAVATSEAMSVAEPLAVFDTATSFYAGSRFLERAAIARDWLVAADGPTPSEVVGKLGNGIAAIDSCVTAIYLATRFNQESFTSLQAFTVKCGGDVDTILAMAGAVWGASNGASALPAECLQSLEERDYIENSARSLHDLQLGRFRLASSSTVQLSAEPDNLEAARDCFDPIGKRFRSY